MSLFCSKVFMIVAHSPHYKDNLTAGEGQTALLQTLPSKSPEAWLAKKIKDANKDPKREARTLEMLCPGGPCAETAKDQAPPPPGEAVVLPRVWRSAWTKKGAMPIGFLGNRQCFFFLSLLL